MDKRPVFVARCKCGWRRIVEKDPPKEVLCPICNVWLKFESSSTNLGGKS